MKSLNHGVSQLLIPQIHPAVGVLQPNNKTSCQNSEVDFPCSIVTGPKEGGPGECLGVGHQQELGTLDQCISDVPCMDYTHTYRSNMATVGREMYKYGLHASGILV